MSTTKPKSRLKTFRVYVGQINQTMVRVKAQNAESAAQKGYALWRREWAHSVVRAVELDQEGQS